MIIYQLIVFHFSVSTRIESQIYVGLLWVWLCEFLRSPEPLTVWPGANPEQRRERRNAIATRKLSDVNTAASVSFMLMSISLQVRAATHSWVWGLASVLLFHHVITQTHGTNAWITTFGGFEKCWKVLNLEKSWKQLRLPVGWTDRLIVCGNQLMWFNAITSYCYRRVIVL